MASYIGSRLCDRHMKEYLQTLVCAIRETNVCTLAASVSSSFHQTLYITGFVECEFGSRIGAKKIHCGRMA